MINKMTDSEKMVWAAAFGAAVAAGRTNTHASSAGDDAVFALNDCIRRNDPTAKDFASEAVTSDVGDVVNVEAALVDILNDDVEADGAWFKREIEKRIGRKLRGAK